MEARLTFFESAFLLPANEFFVVASSVLDNFGALIPHLSSYFSYFLFFISFVFVGLYDGETPSLRKRLNGLNHHSLSCVFSLLGLELVFVKLDIFSRARAVT